MSKPLFGPCDSYQLAPFSYPWAWEMYKDCRNNEWAPDEIRVHNDVADYKDSDLDPAHRHVFESIMAQLTTFDIERGDDAAETFLQILQPAELKHFLKRLIFEEAGHTQSYRYCIENLGVPESGPNNIYDRWKTIPVMKARVEMAQGISDSLMSEPFNPDNPEHVHRFFRAAFFWFLIFEGVWFWMNLCGPVQALARLGRFENTAEQFQYILRDEQQHVRFGVELIKTLIQHYPKVISDKTLGTIHNDIVKAVQLEDDFISYVLSAGSILGYPETGHRETTRYFVNMRLRSVGLPNFYVAPTPKHQFPWFS
jgi:ribonucleoside-diphosphate reductase beta chain